MTDSNSKLEFELDILTEDAFDMGADGLDPMILAAWRRLCSETLSELMNRNVNELSKDVASFVVEATSECHFASDDLWGDSDCG